MNSEWIYLSLQLVWNLFLFPIDSSCCHRTFPQLMMQQKHLYEWIKKSSMCNKSHFCAISPRNLQLWADDGTSNMRLQGSLMSVLTALSHIPKSDRVTYSDLRRPSQIRSFHILLPLHGLLMTWIGYFCLKSSACIKTNTHIEISFVCWHLKLLVCVYPSWKCQLGTTFAI